MEINNTDKGLKLLLKLSEMFENRFNHFYNVSDDLLEGELGNKFYDSMLTHEFQPKEIFTVKMPIDYLNEKAQKKIMAAKRETTIDVDIPIDTTLLEEFLEEFDQAKENDEELYIKYKRWATWYNDFNRLIFGALPETDACLFLAAAAFASANTALDVNIIEAAKLYSAVKTDFKRGNAGRQGLKFIANNVNTVDQQEGIDILKKLANANLSYAQLLVPKRDITSKPDKKGIQKQVREITVSNAKLTNYNKFVLYFLQKGGKLSKKQIMKDLQTGELYIGGTKVYSFFINLIDPDYEWVNFQDTDLKVMPATIDRWMIKLFFTRPIQKLIDEMVNDGIMEDDKTLHDQFLNAAVMDLFGKDNVRKNIVRILNDYSKDHDLNPQQMQAFGWVKLRDESGIPTAKFSSFEDVIDFTQKLKDRIEDINPELLFIKDVGDDVKDEFREVLPTIKLLTKIPRWQGSKEAEIERAIQNWKEFNPEYDLDTSDKPSVRRGVSANVKYHIYTKEMEPGKWQADMKFKNESLGKYYGSTKNEVIKKSIDWIRKNKTLDVLRAEKQRLLNKKGA